MAKRKITSETESSLLKIREKKKWQIALRRYVLDRNICLEYAPFFGLDIENMRSWFECQFANNIGWEDFASKWQFEHVIPLSYFDLSDETELKMCWNFTNLGVSFLSEPKQGFDLLSAKRYFNELYETTGYRPCRLLLDKINSIEEAGHTGTEKQKEFIKKNIAYLNQVADYAAFEFELINRGRGIEDVKKEADFIRKYQGNAQ